MPHKQSLLGRVSAGIFLGSPAEVIATASYLTATIIVLSVLTVSQYGLWRLAISLLSIVHTFSFTSLDRLLIADLARFGGHGEKVLQKELFSQYSKTILSVAFVVTVAFTSVVLFTGAAKGEFRTILLILAMVLLLNTFRRILCISFSAQLQFATAAALNSFQRVMYLPMIALFLLVLKYGLTGVAIAHLTSTALGVVAFLPSFVKELRKEKLAVGENSPRVSLWTNIRTYGKWSMFAEVADSFTVNTKLWILAYFLGLEAVGIFGFARQLISQVTSIIPVSRILNSVLPHEFQDKKRFSFISQRALKYSLWLGLVTSTIAVATITPLVEWVVPAYKVALPYFYVMLPSVVFGSLTVVIAFMLYAAQLQKYFFYGTLTKVVFASTFFPLLVWLFGLWGAASEYLVLAIAMLLSRYVIMKKKTGLDLGRVSLGFLFTTDSFDRQQVLRIKGWLQTTFASSKL